MLEFIIINLYGIAGVVGLCAYFPQVIKLWSSESSADDISIKTWTIWTGNAVVSMMYGSVVLKDPLYFILSVADMILLVTIISLVIQNRYVRYGDRKHFFDALVYYYGFVIWRSKQLRILTH